MANLIVTFKLLFVNRNVRMLRQGSLQDRLKSRGTSLFQVDHDHDPGVYGDVCDAEIMVMMILMILVILMIWMVK